MAWRAVGALLGFLGLVYAVFVWPGRWRYETVQRYGVERLMRVDRISGEAEELYPELGWVPRSYAAGAR